MSSLLSSCATFLPVKVNIVARGVTRAYVDEKMHEARQVSASLSPPRKVSFLVDHTTYKEETSDPAFAMSMVFLEEECVW